MRKFWPFAVLMVFLTPMLMGASCGKQVVRDGKTLTMEVKFFSQANLQQAELLKEWVAVGCTCDASKKFIGDSAKRCLSSAKKALVVEARIPWHSDMAMHNAGLKDERPPKVPPTVPDTGTLCPAPVVAPVVVPTPADTPAVVPATAITPKEG